MSDSDPAVGGLEDWRALVIRFDPVHGRVVVDLGDCELYSAATMLRMALRRVDDEIDTDEVEDDEDEDNV